ncbi:phosphocarrier protein [Terribacillus halophilus]|uniref:Phosphocarrier protein n=1 Tax=Terribacillus halophilus TaxID=361279 RepID=A0A1G6W530_9BACI|nr:HPr family phosphocarrier protein [Terribacillus halophilus]SDD61040.1 phosphocarrier protein [Terribacillus halophilus]
MLEKNFYVTIETGFARYAAGLINVAGKFSSNIHIQCQGKSVELKNAPECIMQIMNLGIYTHSSFMIRADGTDEIQAIDAISDHFRMLDTRNGMVNLQYKE